MAVSRMRRVNEVLREVIGEQVKELSDPGLEPVTITEVDTSPDLRHAKVYFTVLGGDAEKDTALEALGRAHGSLQAAIGSETRMKRTPSLRFLYDEAVEKGLRIASLLDDHEGGER